MKQKDIILIIVVVFISSVASFFISGLLFPAAKTHSTPVEKVEPISASFSQPDKAYFNDNAIDPAKLITIGDSNNSDPFASTQ